MIKVSVENKIHLPANLYVYDDLLYIANRIIVPLLVKGIDDQVTITGGSFPALEPATIERKSQKTLKSRAKAHKTAKKHGANLDMLSKVVRGISNKTLIDTGTLRKSFMVKKDFNLVQKAVEITINDDRKEIGGYLQIEGVGKKKKKFHFFGITDGMEKNAFDYMKKQIKKVTAKFNGR